MKLASRGHKARLGADRVKALRLKFGGVDSLRRTTSQAHDDGSGLIPHFRGRISEG